MGTKGAAIDGDGGATVEQFASAGDRAAMTTPQPVSKDTRDVLRGTVARVERELALVDIPPALRAAWVSLTDALALGPTPELRDCPACGNVCRRAATRCGYCWIALVGVTDLPGVRP
jgi:hypothetical protein